MQRRDVIDCQYRLGSESCPKGLNVGELRVDHKSPESIEFDATGASLLFTRFNDRKSEISMSRFSSKSLSYNLAIVVHVSLSVSFSAALLPRLHSSCASDTALPFYQCPIGELHAPCRL